MEWVKYWQALDCFLMGQEITHFSARELSKASTVYRKRLGKQVAIHNGQAPRALWDNALALCRLLETIRHHFRGLNGKARPVLVTSGYRSPEYNKAIGGASKSQHKEFQAADIQIDGIPPGLIYKWMEKNFPDKYGRGKYSTFCHVDVRKKYSRWTG